MRTALLIIRTVLAAVRDVVYGSVLLTRRITGEGRRVYSKLPVPTVPGAPATPETSGAEPGTAVPGSAATAPAAGEPDGQPAAETSQTPAANAAHTRHDEGGRARRKRGPWTLDHVAAAVFFGWAAWCFGRRPVAAGWLFVAPDLAALAPWAAGCWVVAAWLTAQHDKRHQEPDHEEPACDGEGAPDAARARWADLWLWHLVCTRVQAAVAEGRRGVHLKTLLEEPGIPETWTVSTLREHCERLEIPVKPMQIRGSGTGPTHGVHVDELTAVLGMPLQGAVTALQALLAQEGPDTSGEAVGEASTERALEAPGGPAEEGPADRDSRPGKRWTFQELLGAYFAGAADPTSTPRPTPPPSPSPAPPGRG